jgi:hypothetical protein
MVSAVQMERAWTPFMEKRRHRAALQNLAELEYPVMRASSWSAVRQHRFRTWRDVRMSESVIPSCPKKSGTPCISFAESH